MKHKSHILLVSYPTRWSFSFILGPLHWSSIFLTSRGKRNIVQLCTNNPSDSSKLKINMFVRIRLRSDLKITLCKSEWCRFDQMLVKKLLRNRKNCRMRSLEACFSSTWKSWMLPQHSALGCFEKYANPASHLSWFLSTPDYLLIWKQVPWNIDDPLVLVGDIGTGEFTRPIWVLIPNPSLTTVTLFLLPKGCPKIFGLRSIFGRQVFSHPTSLLLITIVWIVLVP